MTKKRIILAVSAAAVVAAAAVVGIWLSRRASAVVKVYNFDMVGMTEYWGDSKESYGPVSTDKVQTVFLTETQEITEVCVQLGDVVKKGDLLLRFDTTLSDLALERKRLEVEKVKLQLQDAKDELTRIKNMKPLVPHEPPKPSDDQGSKVPGTQYFGFGDHVTEKDSQFALYDGSSASTPLVIWVMNGAGLSGALEEGTNKALQMQQWAWDAAHASSSESTDPGETGEDSGESEGSGSEGTDPGTGGDPAAGRPTAVSGYYAVLKMTSGDFDKGAITVLQGAYVTGGAIHHLYDIYSVNRGFIDPLTSADEPAYVPQDNSSGYTYAEIQKMRQAKEKEIKDLEFKVKTAEAAYKIAQAEAGDGNIYAQTDGRITALVSQEEAKLTHSPILKLSGGGGFYIRGSVNELDREMLTIGQTVTVQDWANGGFYEGTVYSVGEFPTADNRGYGNGNPNASFYPFTVFVDESADLAAGSYVSIQYSLEASSQGVYLEMPFLRSESGENYVYVRGENGRLEKRAVTTGKTLWGSYIQVTSGLSREDMVAFPYGKTVRVGAKCEEGTPADLYGY